MRKPPFATTIMFGLCGRDCGLVHIDLYDGEGRVIAKASLDPDAAIGAAWEMLDAAEEIRGARARGSRRRDH